MRDAAPPATGGASAALSSSLRLRQNHRHPSTQDVGLGVFIVEAILRMRLFVQFIGRSPALFCVGLRPR